MIWREWIFTYANFEAGPFFIYMGFAWLLLIPVLYQYLYVNEMNHNHINTSHISWFFARINHVSTIGFHSSPSRLSLSRHSPRTSYGSWPRAPIFMWALVLQGIQSKDRFIIEKRLSISANLHLNSSNSHSSCWSANFWELHLQGWKQWSVGPS